jgi:arsenate reductase
VITVCDNARETCPFFPGAKNYIHKRFEDPSSVEGTDEDKLNAFRKSRDEIKGWIIEFFCNNS